LKSFIAENADQVKLFLTEEDYNIDLDSLTEKIHSIFDQKKTVFIKTTNNLLKLSIAEIFYIQKKNSEVLLHLPDKKIYGLPEKFAYYEEAFKKYNIVQIAEDVLINPRFIESYSIQQRVLFCYGNIKLNVKKNYETKLINALNNFR
jgi:DNA-binding LytR/AlgR family response regulator